MHNVLSIEIAKEAISSSKENLLTTGALEDENHLSMTSVLQKAIAVKISKQKSFENYSKNIRSKSRSYTAGQMAQVKVNLSHNKVYSKKSAMELVCTIAPEIENRSFEAMSDQLWQELNAYMSLDDKRAFAKDKSDMIV